MKKFLQFILLGLGVFALLGGVVSAADQDTGQTGGLAPDTDPSAVSKDDVTEVIVNVINWLLGFAAVAATGFLIFGGYMWMSSAGNAERIEDGKRIVTGAIIGLLMIILAAVLVNTIIGLFGREQTTSQTSMLLLGSLFYLG